MPNTEYVIWVIAVNKQGLGEKKDVYTVTTLAPSESRLLVNDIALYSVYDLIVSSCLCVYFIYLHLRCRTKNSSSGGHRFNPPFIC